MSFSPKKQEQTKTDRNLESLNILTKYLKVHLMPHQVDALEWMLHRENQNVSGGILADDMGLGKTLSMISFIVESQIQNKKPDTTLAGTLIISPLSLINQWKNEIENKTNKGLLTVEIYHGNERNKCSKILAQKKVVITTYGIITTEVGEPPLFSLNWRRIILDEAHQIKNYKSKTAEAVFELSSKSRWAVTGTPIHNSENDLYSLLKFLRYAPYDDFQECKNLVNNPHQLANVRSKIMLRRTKSVLKEKSFNQTLPEKTIKILKIKLNEDEKEIYDYIKARKYHHVLVRVLLLRQICCHPHLIVQKLQKRDDNDYSPSKNQRSEKNDKKGDNNDLDCTKSVFKIQNPSSKIKHLLNLLKKITSQKEKAVVVSQWTSFLDLIAVHTKKENISFDHLTGKTATSKRTTIIDNFNNPKSATKVLLLSLTAGGVGLNLVGANHLFLMDLHWNPQLENQAQDRIYRIGQEKPVYIYKFLTVDTIEERIKDLQDKKLKIADSVLGTNDEDVCKVLLEII